MSLIIKSAAFTPIEFSESPQTLNVENCFNELAPVLAQQTKKVLGDIDQAEIARHFLCSTMLELPFTSGAASLADVNAENTDASSYSSFINTYECASWGYSLRYYLKQVPDSRYLLVSILDANVLRLNFWKQNENWGKSGFGLCTFLLEVDQDEPAAKSGAKQDGLAGNSPDNLITASCAVTYNSTPEFATIIRRMVTGKEDITLSLPFFPENIRQIFTRMLGSFKQLPDLHDRWGHCFGSDPWLSIINQGVTQGFQEPTKILACSIALNGYYCMAEVTANAQSRFYLEDAA
jgi:hypothetical protein